MLDAFILHIAEYLSLLCILRENVIEIKFLSRIFILLVYVADGDCGLVVDFDHIVFIHVRPYPQTVFDIGV